MSDGACLTEVSVCGSCDYEQPGRIVSVLGEFLFRCPRCGAYDWIPEPIEREDGRV